MINGYISLDLKDLVMDGVENTLDGLSSKIEAVVGSNKPVVICNLKLKKELTGLAKDVEVAVAHANIVEANGVYVLTSMLASMNINININKINNKYKGIKF